VSAASESGAEALTGPGPSPPPGRPGRLGRIVRYGLSRGLTEGLFGVRALLLAPLLGPAGVGVWTLFRLGLRYSVFVGLGVNRGLEREAVRHGVQGDERSAGDVSRVALGFNLLLFVPVALSLLAASLLVSDDTLSLGLRGVGAAVLSSQLTGYALVYLRARGSLRTYATIEVVSATLHLAFATVFAWRWGLSGAIAGFVCADLVALALLLPRVPFRPALSWPAVRKLLGVGFPVMLSGLTATILATADRLVVAAMAGTAVLGYYAFAASIAGLAASAAWVIRIVIFPDVYSHAARAGAASAVRDHLERTVLPFARVFPPLLGVAALAIAPAVLFALPNFAPAVAPARIFIFTGVTFGLTNLGALAVVAADRQRRLPVFAVGALVVNLTLSYALLASGAGLEAVAVGAVFSQALYASAVLDVGAKVAGLNGPGFLVRVLTPLGWCVTVVAAIGAVIPGTDPRSLAASAAAYTLALLPLYPALWSDLRKLARRSPRETLASLEEDSLV
jgi:O-antigen/teichoic acid export membrane protein